MTKNTEDDDGWKKFRSSWEYRSMRFVIKTLGYIVLLLYALTAGSAAYSWGSAKWILSRPLSDLQSVVDGNIENNQKAIGFWIALRPADERADIVKMLEPHTGRLNPFLFLAFSKWALEEGNLEDALFWRQYGLYRARFDALRCGSFKATENVSSLLGLIDMPAINDYIREKPARVPASIRRVLAYDARYPAENSPLLICNAVKTMEKGNYTPVDEKDWAAIRHTLRIISEHGVQELEKAQKPDGKKKKK